MSINKIDHTGKEGSQTMPMINAPVIKAVQELLQDRGIAQRQNERLGDYVARGLGISAAQAETLLEALHEGCTIEEAQRRAGVEALGANGGLLTAIAQTIGSALGKIQSKL
jgi:hypothetical protein